MSRRRRGRDPERERELDEKFGSKAQTRAWFAREVESHQRIQALRDMGESRLERETRRAAQESARDALAPGSPNSDRRDPRPPAPPAEVQLAWSVDRLAQRVERMAAVAPSVPSDRAGDAWPAPIVRNGVAYYRLHRVLSLMNHRRDLAQRVEHAIQGGRLDLYASNDGADPVVLALEAVRHFAVKHPGGPGSDPFGVEPDTAYAVRNLNVSNRALLRQWTDADPSELLASAADVRRLLADRLAHQPQHAAASPHDAPLRGADDQIASGDASRAALVRVDARASDVVGSMFGDRIVVHGPAPLDLDYVTLVVAVVEVAKHHGHDVADLFAREPTWPLLA